MHLSNCFKEISLEFAKINDSRLVGVKNEGVEQMSNTHREHDELKRKDPPKFSETFTKALNNQNQIKVPIKIQKPKKVEEFLPKKSNSIAKSAVKKRVPNYDYEEIKTHENSSDSCSSDTDSVSSDSLSGKIRKRPRNF